jgi:DNA-binding response OmpR family regulator
LDSELGEGSTFTFSIPLAEGEVKDDVGDLPPELYTSSTATVLIIEDDIEILKMLQVTLEAEGLKTFTATSGEDGLRIAREKLPDLISLDIRLPDLDGYEVLQLLKRTPDTADIPVFILSVVDNRKRGLSLGAMDYLVKPFSEDKLMGVVRRALRSKGTIIVAHRDREILLHIRSALQSQGLAVRTTMRGDRALRLTRELVPEVVAFDLALPDIDGVQFIETLKSNQRTANIPIIVMFEDENRRMGLNSLEMDGTVRFVRSPFAVQKLAEDISNLISNDGLSKE